MATKKAATVYECPHCGRKHNQKLPWCVYCETIIDDGEWLSPSDQREAKNKYNRKLRGSQRQKPQLISDVKTGQYQRILIDPDEYNGFDRVLGNGVDFGFVPDSMNIITGEPGIGKSTLLMKTAIMLSRRMRVLYVSAEESVQQIKMRANRIDNNYGDLYLYHESNIDLIVEDILPDIKPDVVIFDSIQHLYGEDINSEVGNPSQVKYAATVIQSISKQLGLITISVSHVNKDGSMAGSNLLQHVVDAVFYMEGQEHSQFRVLRSTKNRFGNTMEAAVYKMTSAGLEDVKNPSLEFLSGRSKDRPGSSLVVTMNGITPLLLEVQALVNNTANNTNGTLQATGLDRNRLRKICEIIIHHLNVDLGTRNVYGNVVGGLHIEEPSVDLSLAFAIMSSVWNVAIPDVLPIAEVGLAGELRSVKNMDRRLSEASLLGMNRVITCKLDDSVRVPDDLNLVQVSNIRDAIRYVFGDKVSVANDY